MKTIGGVDGKRIEVNISAAKARQREWDGWQENKDEKRK
jgi:hypothetical protein